MAAFLYQVKNDSGLTVYGLTEAKDIKDVKRQFRSSELYFIDAQPYDLKNLAKMRLSLDDLLMFTHRFMYLIEAGLPILSALYLLWKQSDRKETQIIVSYIRKELEDGSTLQEAFEAFPNVFPVMYRALIGVAEIGAGLVKILQKLSQYLQDQKKFIDRIKRATMYPAFVLGFAILVMIGMFAFIVPTFQKVIVKLHGTLPPITKVLFFISGLMRNGYFILFILLLGVGTFFLIKYLRQKPEFNQIIDSWKIKAPILKSFLYPLTVGRFTRSLSLLIGSGVPLLKSIEIAKTTIVNIPIEKALDEINKQVVEGGTLYDAFKSTKIFPVLAVEMVGIGESSGKLHQLLEKVSDHLDEEADYAIAKFLTMLEPILIILVGGIVLTVLLGIYLPIFSLQDTLRTY